MKIRSILLLCLWPFGLGVCQTNLVVNPSLEAWVDHMPVGWKVVSNTVDVFKSDVKVVPLGQADAKFRKKLPKAGHHGLSYLGLAGDEIVEAQLARALEPGKTYELSCWVYRPPLYSKIASNQFSVKLLKASAKPGINSQSIQDFVVLATCDGLPVNQPQWVKVKALVKAKGGEDHLLVGFFKGLPLEFGVIYYLFDDFVLREAPANASDTLQLFYPHNEFALTNALRAELDDFLREKAPDHLQVFSFASKMGGEAFNQNLSEKRTAAILEAIHRSAPHVSCEARSLGESHSAPGAEERFRRVDIVVSDCIQHKDGHGPSSTDLFDQGLMRQLATIAADDQRLRAIYDSLFQINSSDTAALHAIDAEIGLVDADNLTQIEAIIAAHGYPGLSLVGPDYMDVAFLVLQHAPLETREKHWPAILQAEAACEFDRTWLPFMLDRNKVDRGEKQIFGTQLQWMAATKKYEPFPIEDPDNVDRRREGYHLGPLKNYILRSNQ